MLFSFIYLVFVSLLKLLIGSGRPGEAKDVELIVMRHQLDVLRREVERVGCRNSVSPENCATRASRPLHGSRLRTPDARRIQRWSQVHESGGRGASGCARGRLAGAFAWGSRRAG